MHKERSDVFADVKPDKLKGRTMDSILKEKKMIQDVDVLKLDIQGAELGALLGAQETLSYATVVTLEQSVVDYNEGGACYFEVDALLRHYGFHLHDM
jgi:hypothetical protein